MTTKPKFKSDVFAEIHASATALQKVGAIDHTTMRKFDASCLATPAALMSQDYFSALEETAYLLRSPENARRLKGAINKLNQGD
jgi:DNA-binding transcriptional regulator YiaG